MLASLVWREHYVLIMDNSREKRIFDTLSDFLCGDWVILGVGNILRCDDGFGSVLVQRLCKSLDGTGISKRIFDGGVAPENFLGKLQKMAPEKLLIIDAIFFGGAPGEVILLNIDELAAPMMMTHGPSNFAMMKMMLAETDIKIFAAQPLSTQLGEKMSAQIDSAIEKSVKMFLRLLNAMD